MKPTLFAALLLMANLAVAAEDWGLPATPTPTLDDIFSYSTPTDFGVSGSVMDAVVQSQSTSGIDRDYDEIQRDKLMYDPQNRPNFNPFLGKDSAMSGTGEHSMNYNAFLGESLTPEAYELYQNVFGAEATKAAADANPTSYFLNESTESPVNVFLSR